MANPKRVIVTLESSTADSGREEIEKVLKDLGEMGFEPDRRTEELQELGIVIGEVESSKIKQLEAIRGVDSVDTDSKKTI